VTVTRLFARFEDLESQNSMADKWNYIGAPKAFELEMACQVVVDAFDSLGCFLVGSATERADWRDVDLRMMFKDEDFAKLFPDAGEHWEHDSRWLLMTAAISDWLSKRSGLPVDFQFQPMTWANKKFDKIRHAVGIRIS
jgi:hypothetical protein